MLSNIISIFLISFEIFSVEGKPDEKFERILYGDDARIEDFPYFAGLMGCGAAIISERHLLTAGHCVGEERVTKTGYAFVGGETQQNSQVVRYKNVIRHPEYVKYQGMPFNDIAVIELATPLTFSKKVQALKIPDKMISRNTSMVFVGKGRDETGQGTKKIKSMDVNGLTIKECLSMVPTHFRDMYEKYLDTIVKMNICATRTDDLPGICLGDSGSPLAKDGLLIGLASFIGPDCHTDRLGFYLNVAYYTDWIKHVTGLQ